MKLIRPNCLVAVASLSLAASLHAAPPIPENVLSPSEALARLEAGNIRYVNNDARSRDFSATRAALANGQNPYAAILSCADSRIAPELAFDESRGDLFVVRIAGNFVNTDGLASMEFATAVLNVPLIVVLGHDSCGAINAAIGVVNDGAKLPGHLPHLVKSLKPAVKEANGQEGDLLDNAIRDNVILNVKKLRESMPLLKERVASGKLKVVGAIYHLDTGKVEFIDS